jgi:hypothetical protein
MADLDAWLEAAETAEAAEAPPEGIPSGQRATVNGHDDESPFDKLDKAAGEDWHFTAFVTMRGYEKLTKPPDSQTLAAYKRPGAESAYSVKILKANPHVAVAHSDQCGLPTGGDQKLTFGRICAWWYHDGDVKAAARAMNRGRPLTCRRRCRKPSRAPGAAEVRLVSKGWSRRKRSRS